MTMYPTLAACEKRCAISLREALDPGPRPRRPRRALEALANAVALRRGLRPAPSRPAAMALPACLLGSRLSLPEPPRDWRFFATRVARGAAAAVLAAHIAYIATTSFLVACYAFVPPSATVLMAYRAWSSGWKLKPPAWIPLERIPKFERRMVVSIEDYRFYEHFGIDFEAIKRAWDVNQAIGRNLYGGSTITMQVARTLFLVPAKSYVRKYLEAIVALELEAILSKDRILELYLNYAEWGKGVFGIEAASRRYFGSGARSLDTDQASRLFAILSSPIKYDPSTLAKSSLLRQRYEFLVKRYGS